MDLNKMSNQDKLLLCRKYYIGGFFALPFLWAINTLWFGKEAFFKPIYEEQRKIRSYVIQSAVGSLIWIAAIMAWNIVFQQNRASWGATADYLSFVIPQGIA